MTKLDLNNILKKMNKKHLIIGGGVAFVIILSLGLGLGLGLETTSNNESPFATRVESYVKDLTKITKETIGDDKDSLLNDKEYNLIDKEELFCGGDTIKEANEKLGEITYDYQQKQSVFLKPKTVSSNKYIETTLPEYRDQTNVKVKCWNVETPVFEKLKTVNDHPLPTQRGIARAISNLTKEAHENRITEDEYMKGLEKITLESGLFCWESSLHFAVVEAFFKLKIKNKWFKIIPYDDNIKNATRVLKKSGEDDYISRSYSEQRGAAREILSFSLNNDPIYKRSLLCWSIRLDSNEITTSLKKIITGMEENGFNAAIFNTLTTRLATLTNLKEKVAEFEKETTEDIYISTEAKKIEEDLYKSIMSYKETRTKLAELKVMVANLATTDTTYPGLKALDDYFSNQETILEAISTTEGVAKLEENILKLNTATAQKQEQAHLLIT